MMNFCLTNTARGLTLVAVFSLLAACGSRPPRVDGHGSGVGAHLVSAARQQLGVPYSYGGATPRGFDCSGLVQYAHRQIGVAVPRSTRQQYHAVQRVPFTRIQPGDLIFFTINQQRVSHVGIYVGDRKFIHAPSAGKRVSYARLDNPYWRRRIVGAGRFH